MHTIGAILFGVATMSLPFGIVFLPKSKKWVMYFIVIPAAMAGYSLMVFDN